MKKLYFYLLFSTIFCNLKSQELATIGNQKWCTENLSVSTFRNGEAIPQAKSNEEWVKAISEKKPAWCFYENQSGNGLTYGKLYNVYALLDSRVLAPKGFHIPTEKEWYQLFTSLGGQEEAGKQLKTSAGWCNNGNGTGISGFVGKPGGFRGGEGDFININCGGYWWSTDKSIFYLNWSHDGVEKNNGVDGGYSIRCIKD
jgi:uncharacterized protein (TIGR02145 family)